MGFGGWRVGWIGLFAYVVVTQFVIFLLDPPISKSEPFCLTPLLSHCTETHITFLLGMRSGKLQRLDYNGTSCICTEIAKLPQAIVQISLLQDDCYAIVAGFHNKLWFIDVHTGKVLHEYHGHVNTIKVEKRVFLCQPLNLMAALGVDGVLRMWDVYTAMPLGRNVRWPDLQSHDDAVDVRSCFPICGLTMALALYRLGSPTELLAFCTTPGLYERISIEAEKDSASEKIKKGKTRTRKQKGKRRKI